MDNQQLVRKFYSAFQQLDYRTMQDCYSDDIVFSDPAFGLLQNEEPKAMWEMLCKRARDLKIEFSDIHSIDDEYLTCNWTAHYTFTATGRKVVNRIKAYMRVKDGKIIEHSDAFKLSKWASQALGLKGAVLGWTNFMKRKIQKNARKNLKDYMERHYAGKPGDPV